MSIEGSPAYHRTHAGKRVFKKPVKLTMSVVPTQTPSLPTPSALITPTTHDSTGASCTVQPGSPVTSESIVFDGKTFTVTFSQISGIVKCHALESVHASCVCLCAGPTRRFRRVCEKLQAATVNPSSVNRMSMELVDFGDNGHSNPSISSDDTLATTASPVLEDAATTNGSREEVSKSILVGGYESTEDECESEDGLQTGMLLHTDLGN